MIKNKEKILIKILKLSCWTFKEIKILKKLNINLIDLLEKNSDISYRIIINMIKLLKRNFII